MTKTKWINFDMPEPPYDLEVVRLMLMGLNYKNHYHIICEQEVRLEQVREWLITVRIRSPNGFRFDLGTHYIMGSINGLIYLPWEDEKKWIIPGTEVDSPDEKTIT